MRQTTRRVVLVTTFLLKILRPTTCLRVVTRRLFVEKATVASTGLFSPQPGLAATIQHPFVYSDSWTGTNLPWVSIDQTVPSRTTTWPMARWPDPVLRRIASPVEESMFGSTLLQEAVDTLINTCHEHDAIGLAAQQCGINARILHMVTTKQPLTMINPVVTARSPETDMRVWNENCLVLPVDNVTVVRDAAVKLQYRTVTGQFQSWQSRTAEEARAVQHELDHDRGILVTDHVSLDELETVMQQVERQGHEERQLRAYERYVW